MATVDKLISPYADKCPHNNDKVTVVGTGVVGVAVAAALLAQGVSSDIALVDMDTDKMTGELLDLQQGSLFLNAKISASSDYAISAGSAVCIITAGLRQQKGETRLALCQRNADVMKLIVPPLIQHSPDTILIVITNPCDIMAWVAWKISGLPKNKVMSSGTTLDSSRFRFFIGDKMGLAPESVHGFIIGEHGDSSVAVWSGVNVGGVPLKQINPSCGSGDDPENWGELHKEVVKAGAKVHSLKGYTNWAVALSTVAIAKSILRNSSVIFPVGINVNGFYNINEDVFLSVPCVIGRNGVTSIVDIHLTEEERCGLKFSAAKLLEVMKGVVL